MILSATIWCSYFSIFCGLFLVSFCWMWLSYCLLFSAGSLLCWVVQVCIWTFFSKVVVIGISREVIICSDMRFFVVNFSWNHYCNLLFLNLFRKWKQRWLDKQSNSLGEFINLICSLSYKGWIFLNLWMSVEVSLWIMLTNIIEHDCLTFFVDSELPKIWLQHGPPCPEKEQAFSSIQLSSLAFSIILSMLWFVV